MDDAAAQFLDPGFVRYSLVVDQFCSRLPSTVFQVQRQFALLYSALVRNGKCADITGAVMYLESSWKAYKVKHTVSLRIDQGTIS